MRRTRHLPTLRSPAGEQMVFDPTASAARSLTSFAASPVWIGGSACTAAVVSWQGNVESNENNGRTPWSAH
jgi:hypothetical protein